MDYLNSFGNERPVFEDLSNNYPPPNRNYASVYQIQYNSELLFVYVQYQEQYPSFSELIFASKYFSCDKIGR